MARFVLVINLGNDAMQSDSDVARALEHVARRLRKLGPGGALETGDAAPIRDDNGNRIGSWHVDEEA
jgi:hypothetical protein